MAFFFCELSTSMYRRGGTNRSKPQPSLIHLPAHRVTLRGKNVDDPQVCLYTNVLSQADQWFASP